MTDATSPPDPHHGVYDVAIVGAGIAGASLAAAIAPSARVLLLEAEDAPGYHATGRSAAFWSETYGGPGVQPLTSASGPMLRAGGFLEPLGSLHVGRSGDGDAMAAQSRAFAGTGVPLTPCDPALLVRGLRPEWTRGLFEPSCAYIDVGALHGSYLTSARRAGAKIVTHARLHEATYVDRIWSIDTGAGRFAAQLLVNAAGAWADDVSVRSSVRPIGIRAFRRTIVQLRTDPPAPAGMPHVTDINGEFYFKPEAGGRVWLSPHDEIPSDPGDVAPDEIDVAVAIDRFERVVDWRVVAVERRWAGLRSFAPDRLPVLGFDSELPSFFWCVGQGGFGIQTAPAAALLGAALLLKRAPDAAVASIDASRYSPARFKR